MSERSYAIGEIGPNPRRVEVIPETASVRPAPQAHRPTGRSPPLAISITHAHTVKPHTITR